MLLITRHSVCVYYWLKGGCCNEGWTSIKTFKERKGFNTRRIRRDSRHYKGAVQKYENGQIKHFKPEAIKKLSDLFNLPPVYFLFDNVPDYNPKEPLDKLADHFGAWFVTFMKHFNDLNDEGRERSCISTVWI